MAEANSAIQLALIDAVPLVEQIASVKREIAMRERNYPKWIRNKKMKAEVADLEIRRMQAVLKTLEDIWRREQPSR